MKHYRRLKSEKVVNLFKQNAVITQNGANNLTFEFHLPYIFSTFSKNTEMEVKNVSYNTATIDAIFTIRCLEVNSEDVYDSYTGLGSVIYHSRIGNDEYHRTSPVFKMIQPLNKLTFTISNNETDRNAGVDAADTFIITLIIRDYDLEEIEPEGMPILEPYHRVRPQSRINLS